MSNLVKKSDYNVKVSEIEGKIPSISGLVTTSALTTVENRISSVSNLVKKQIMTQKLVSWKRNHDKCITTPEFNKLTAENVAARLA